MREWNEGRMKGGEEIDKEKDVDCEFRNEIRRNKEGRGGGKVQRHSGCTTDTRSMQYQTTPGNKIASVGL